MSIRLVLFAATLVTVVSSAPAVAHADPVPAIREVDEALVQSDYVAVRLLQLLDETRRAGMPVRTACVDRELIQVNSFARLLMLRRERVVVAAAQGNSREVANERRIIRRLRSEVQRISRAGLQCVYPSAGRNVTIVEVTVSNAIRHEDVDPPPLRP